MKRDAKKEYDIFISYRRDGGESTAKILRDKLTELGYSVFFDVESLRSGDFNKKLYSVIEECDDFLLIFVGRNRQLGYFIAAGDVAKKR